MKLLIVLLVTICITFVHCKRGDSGIPGDDANAIADAKDVCTHLVEQCKDSTMFCVTSREDDIYSWKRTCDDYDKQINCKDEKVRRQYYYSWPQCQLDFQVCMTKEMKSDEYVLEKVSMDLCKKKN